jgi:hypothetical protein
LKAVVRSHFAAKTWQGASSLMNASTFNTAELERRKKQHQETKAHSVANLGSRVGLR